jgi:hypothetical protein
MNFFQKIPEIHLPRFSFKFSFEVVVAIHEKLEKFQNIFFQLRIYQKTSNNSRNVFYVRKLITEINVKINELSDDMHLVTQYLA